MDNIYYIKLLKNKIRYYTSSTDKHLFYKMLNTQSMRVLKRSGDLEEVAFDKILSRIKKIGEEVGIKINYQSLVMKVIEQLYDKISTTKIDELAAEQCASLSTIHYDYGTLGSRIIISNHQKNTDTVFTHVVEKLNAFKNILGENKPLISNDFYRFVMKHGDTLNDMIVYDRDYLIDYFGFKTLEKSYLFRVNNGIVERPQHMWMRVAIGIHLQKNDEMINKEETINKEEKIITLIKETYDLMSQKYFTHATPTLFNAGTNHPQLSSCFLLAMEDDSLDGIYNTLKDCATISKHAGGIGLHIHNIRAKGSHIQGTNGSSNGLVPMLRVFNNTARYVDQCVHPDTFIYTTDGPMAIKDCVAGRTAVYNLNGNTEVIENVLEHPYTGEIFCIETEHSTEPLRITAEHPVYVKRINGEYYWVEVGKLTMDDKIVFSIPEQSSSSSSSSSSASSGLLNDDCYMYGILLGCGNANTAEETYEVRLNFIEEIRFVQKYLNDRCISWEQDENMDEGLADNIVKIRWLKSVNLPFRYSDIYDANGNKRIGVKWLNLNSEQCKQMLKGVLATGETNISQKKPDLMVFQSTSRCLVEGIRFICIKIGFLCGGYKLNVGSSSSYEIDLVEKYCLTIPKIKTVCDLLYTSHDSTSEFVNVDGNHLLSPITRVTTENYSGTLYDLQMTTEHNYMLHNGVVHNGGGKRSGSFAIYLENWHADIYDFLEMRKNHGDEEMKARDLFYALWISDLFMERVKKSENWSLMCPNECPGLSDVYGDEFVALYTRYEAEGKVRQVVPARELWFAILGAQMETGTPYLLYKDAVNRKSNQKNVGVIKSSNLCTEIMEYSSADETAVCNLASIGLPSFVDPMTKAFNYEMLERVVKVITNNLNKVIDINYYPTEKTRTSNLRHRPIGIGVQGLADTFLLMGLAYHSEEARKVNNNIFETIYYAALEKSCELAEELAINIRELLNITEKRVVNVGDVRSSYFVSDTEMKWRLRSRLLQLINEKEYKAVLDRVKDGRECLGAYSTFEGSPASQGMLQFDLWISEATNVSAAKENMPSLSSRYDWLELKERIKQHGIRNSLLVAPMPTASTSQILGFNECFEPFTSNLYSRKTMAGEFILVNKYLMKELIELGVWSEETKNRIIADKGSVQHLSNIGEEMKRKYKITWEIPMKHLIDMSADRGRYICQSQSLNLWMEDPVYNKLTSMHFYAWEKGLKTGIYYLRRKAKHQAQQFTIEPEKNKNVLEEPCLTCSA